MDNRPMQPPPATFNVQQDLVQKKRDLEQAFKDFHELICSKVLEINKSPGVKKTEMLTLNTLVKTAEALDNVNMGEGILALASIAIREQLIARDRINELEYEICLARRDIRELQKKLGVDGGKKTK